MVGRLTTRTTALGCAVTTQVTLRRVLVGRIAPSFLLVVAYVVTARLGLMMDAVAGFATLVWAPTGIALAALLRGGRRLWPGVFIGAFVVNAWVGASPPVAAGIATGNTLEAILGAAALTRVGLDPRLQRVRDVGWLILLGAGASTVASATIGVASLYAGGIVPVSALAPTWRAWWVGDAIGDMVIASLLLVWSSGPRWHASRALAAEGTAVCAIAAGIGLAVFGGNWSRFGVCGALRSPGVGCPCGCDSVDRRSRS